MPYDQALIDGIEVEDAVELIRTWSLVLDSLKHASTLVSGCAMLSMLARSAVDSR